MAFTLTWEPMQQSGMQWCVCVDAATRRVIRIKCAPCVRKAEPNINAWAQRVAGEILTRQLYEESAAGIKAAKLAEAQEAAETAKRAADAMAAVQALYPLEKLPTVTVTNGIAGPGGK